VGNAVGFGICLCPNFPVPYTVCQSPLFRVIISTLLHPSSSGACQGKKTCPSYEDYQHDQIIYCMCLPVEPAAIVLGPSINTSVLPCSQSTCLCNTGQHHQYICSLCLLFMEFASATPAAPLMFYHLGLLVMDPASATSPAPSL
jgi:hypothetical protein